MIDAATESIITLSEAARRLGKTRATVASYVRAGKLDAVNLDGRPHTSLEALRRFASPIMPECRRTIAQTRAAHRRAVEELTAAGIL
jgi:hypothetical protein